MKRPVFIVLVAVLALQSAVFAQSIFKKSKPDTLNVLKTIANFEMPADTISHRIRPGDRLRIQNLNSISTIFAENVNLTGGVNQQQANVSNALETLVDRNGQVALPRVGRVKLAGLTRIEAANEIEHRYDSTITNPIFDVTIMNLRIKVLGGVNKQGLYILEQERITLGEALAMAGGIDFTVADKSIKLIRPRDGIQEEVNFDIRDLSNPKISNIMVSDGDYIFVQPSKASLRNVKFQRANTILQPIAIGLNVLAIIIALWPRL